MATMEQLTEILKKEKVILYGAHAIAKDSYLLFHHYNLIDNIQGFAVTSLEGNPDEIEGVPVRMIDNYLPIREEAYVVIVTPNRFHHEINIFLEKKGFRNIVFFGDFGLLESKRTLIISKVESDFPHLKITDDENEILCLKIAFAEAQGHEMKFFVLSNFPYTVKSRNALKQFSLEQLHKQKGDFPKLSDLAAEGESGKLDDLKIFVASSKGDYMVPMNNLKPWEIPVFGGSALSEGDTDSKIQRDDDGVNISLKNRIYAEMSVTYWAWKNSCAPYKGLCHYRRRFLLTKQEVAFITSGEVDVVLTMPRVVVPDVTSWFSEVSSLSVGQLQRLKALVLELYPDYADSANTLFSGLTLYPNNMVIAKAEIFDQYCEWIFHILDIVEHDDRFIDFWTQSRYTAYSAELLTSLYFMHNSDKMKIAITEYRFY